MDDARPVTSVAILVHHPSQWPQALSTCKVLRASGAAVALFCLGQAPMTLDPPPEDSCLECFADTCQIGMDCLPLQAIAERLKGCDLVIPI